MFNIAERRKLFFSFSGILLGLGLLVMIYSTVTTGSPFRLSIDFAGGSIYEFAFTEGGKTEGDIRAVFSKYGDENVTIQAIGAPEQHRWSVRGAFKTPEISSAILADLKTVAPLETDAWLMTDTVSETIGGEVTRAAFVAISVGVFIVTLFIVLAFRQVPHAVRYGISAIIAMIHDVLTMMMFASLMGILFGWEIDALFLTAVLTVAGFSVQDTIVTFDRIRENIPKYLGESFETIVDRSVLETIHRSLATQLNAFFIMVAILFFGGDTIKQFVAILFVGLVSGTYSSIFIAVPLVVSWQKGEIPLVNRIKFSLPESADADLA